MALSLTIPSSRETSSNVLAETAGLGCENELHGEGTDGGSERPVSLRWITDDLLQLTQEVWSRAYERFVTEDEAIEMLINVKRLAEVLFSVSKGGNKE